MIAAVNGFCTAGGMEMLGGTDLRVCCPEAKFAVMEPKRGLFAGGGTTVRLPRQIPWPAAMEFLLCADLIPAARAYEMGLRERSRAAATSCSTPRSVRAPHHRERAARRAGDEGQPRSPASTSTSTSCTPRNRALRHVINVLSAVADSLPDDAATDARLAIADAEQAVKELRTAFQQESAHSTCGLRQRGRQGRPEGVRREAHRRSGRGADG